MGAGRTLVSCGTATLAKTVHNIHLTLHRALQDAVADGLIVRNPAAAARSAPRRPEMLTWTESQLSDFLDATCNDRLFPLWRLAAMSGMRRGEMLGLKWEDLDLGGATVTISRQWKRGEKGLVLAPPKTERGRRTIDIDQATISALQKWRQTQRQERMAHDGAWIDTGFIFTRRDGSPNAVDVVSQQFDRLVDRARLPTIRFHDLRHHTPHYCFWPACRRT